MALVLRRMHRMEVGLKEMRRVLPLRKQQKIFTKCIIQLRCVLLQIKQLNISKYLSLLPISRLPLVPPPKFKSSKCKLISRKYRHLLFKLTSMMQILCRSMIKPPCLQNFKEGKQWLSRKQLWSKKCKMVSLMHPTWPSTLTLRHSNNSNKLPLHRTLI